MNLPAIVARDFERESHRIDQLIWDALALHAGETALFCGFANDLEWIRRAASVGVAVTVVSDDMTAMRELRDVPVEFLRGSTSMLPVRDASFDVTIAFHYLHEVDPLFHTNIVSELARTGRRCIIVEPSPPSDPLGSRIASLYSRAKRQLGEFENYHHIDYWRKLLAIVKPNVTSQTFSFLRTPPAQAVRDTVSLIIDTMAAEDTPEAYLAELRVLAARPDAQLVPQARYVVVGTTADVPRNTAAGSHFRDERVEELQPVVNAKPFVPPAIARQPAPSGTAAEPVAPRVYSAPETEAEFPAVLPPATTSKPGSSIARNAFGLAAAAETPATPDEPENAGDLAEEGFGISAASLPAEFGWAWEPPEDAT